MAYYNVCQNCGSNLDPGERCDCESIKAKEQEARKSYYRQFLRTDEEGGQLSFVFENQREGVIGA